MKRGLLMALVVAGICAAVAVKGGTAQEHKRAAERAAAAQPDTSSPNWKELSADLGVMIRDDERLGFRGRLYVRVEGAWYPVATDGPADVHPAVPVK